MKIKEAIEKGTIELKMEHIDTPKLKARMLMQFILNKSRQEIIVHDQEILLKSKEMQYFEAIKKLREGVPLEHITHQKEFMRLNFFVNEDVLIPRQDTEVLVEEAIKISKRINAKKILDLCTGSGAIAVSLAKYIENSEITAVDISHQAIQIAKKNAVNNQVENQITFVESNLFENLSFDKYDMIVSNPPYIKNEMIKNLDLQVQKEPYIALDGGKDGLDFYRKIIGQSDEYLKYGGYLCLEIGYDQKIDVIELIENEEKYQDTYCKKDYYGNDRVIITHIV